MQVVGASRVFVCDKDFKIIENGGIAFKDKIIEVGDYNFLCKKYQQGNFYENCVLLPSFVNPHIHFEFSNNTSSFLYGSFSQWLESVMQQRDLVLDDNQKAIQDAIDAQLLSGVGSVGAVSSYGGDMELLAHSPLKVVFFNEAIGSNPAAVDFLYKNFLQRLESSQDLKSPTFFPGIAIHSPYSVHFILAKKILNLAREKNFLTSVHFLESKEEREWLDNSMGWFKSFYQKTLAIQNPKSLYKSEDFIELFADLDTLFVHCLYATENEMQSLTRTGYIVTCPKSNRLLNNKLLDFSQINKEKLLLATDGKSSNNNLNYLDELRTSLFAYTSINSLELAIQLLLSATLYGARALRLNNGTLQEDFASDFSLFEIEGISNSKQEPLHFLLHAKKVKKIFINGKEIF